MALVQANASAFAEPLPRDVNAGFAGVLFISQVLETLFLRLIAFLTRTRIVRFHGLAFHS